MTDYVVKIGETIRSALLDKLHALFRSDLPIGLHNRRGSRSARGIIGGHGVLNRRLKREFPSQYARVNNGLGGAVRADRIHGMGRIAQQRHPAKIPARQRVTVDHRILVNRLGLPH